MIQRYEPMILTNIINDKPAAIMWPNDNGGYVAEVAHRAAVLELVDVLREIVQYLDDYRYLEKNDALDYKARAAIAKHQEGKE